MLAGAFVLLQVREKPVVPTPQVIIPPNSVGTRELKDGAVTLAKLASEVKVKLLDTAASTNAEAAYLTLNFFWTIFCSSASVGS